MLAALLPLYATLQTAIIEHAYATDGIIPTPANQKLNTSTVVTSSGSASDQVNQLLFTGNGGTPGIVGQALTIGTAVAGGIAVLYVIWAGVQYIMAGGSPDKTKAARARIVGAVVGIVLIMATYAIIRFAIAAGRLVDTASTKAN